MTPNEPFQIPRAPEAEQSVIGGLCLDNNAIDRIGVLQPDAFFSADNRRIYAAIVSLIAQQKPADLVTITSADPSIDMAYLNQIILNTPSAANIGHYAETVREKALMRGVLSATSRIQEIVHEPGRKAAEILDSAQSELSALADTTTSKEPAPINEAMTRYLELLDDRMHGRAADLGMPTGLADLDAILNGGLRRGALITLGARPGMGKSAIAESIACNMSRDYSVLFLSMEMPESEVTERAIANWGRVSSTKLATAKNLSSEDWNNTTKAALIAQNSKLFIDDQPGLTLLEVTLKARQVKRKHGLDVLVVDYLQLMSGSEEKRYQQIEAITKGLKILAKTLNIAVLALSQFSREIEKRPNPRPKPSDFRDGGSIEQDSDVLLGLYREEVDKPDIHNLKGWAQLYVMKNRQGKTGDINLAYLGDYMRFENFVGERPQAPEEPKKSRGFE